MIASFMDLGYLPALVKVTNTSSEPQSMRSLVLNVGSGRRSGAAIPNDALPNSFSAVNWHALGANIADAAAATAVLVGVVAAYYYLAIHADDSPLARAAFLLAPNVEVAPGLQIGAGYGVLCPGGIPQSWDGKPFSNAEASAYASACFKKQTAVRLDIGHATRKITKIVDLDYTRALLPYQTLAPGASAVGLQFFKMPKGLVDWKGLELRPETDAAAAAVLASTAPQRDGATITDAAYFKAPRGARMAIPFLPAASCGFDKETGRFTMRFKDTYGDNVTTQKIEIHLSSRDLPATGSDWTFDSNHSDQRAELFLGPELGEVNSQWRTTISFGHEPSRCHMHVDRLARLPLAGRTLDDDGKLTFHDQFALSARLSCERLADWDFVKTKAWVRFDAALGCSGPMPAARSRSTPLSAARSTLSR
jgi:hypothetical protein